MLEKVVLEEMGTLSPPSEPLESCLIGNCGNKVDARLDEERGVYKRILNSTQPYLPIERARDILNVEVRPSNEDKKITSEVELNPYLPI